MTKTAFNTYKALLKAKQAQLAQGLRNRQAIFIEKLADALEEVQLAGERDLAIRNLHCESKLLRDVRAALTRMAEGCYGNCLHCDGEISPKRLAAVPWAAYCIKCQEAADRHEFDSAEAVAELAADAA